MNKKSTIVIFLLFLIVTPLVFAIYSIVEKGIIENRMKARMEEENLQTIIINTAEIVWLKAEKELLINGEPFDVKKITRNASSITVQGLFDLQEKKLHSKLRALQDARSKSSATNNSLLLLIFTSFYKSADPANYQAVFFILAMQTWQQRRDSLCNLYKEISTPPPRFL